MKLTAPQRGVLASFAFLLISMLSAQTLAFDDGRFRYTVTSGTTVGVTGATRSNRDKDLVIPATASDDGTTYSVTSIGGYAFYVKALTSVTIPDSVTSIGQNAFYNNDLTSVIIGNSVTSIGESAFLGNTFTSVIIPDSVTSIGRAAFAGNFLTSVTIPDSVTTMGEYAFQYNALTSVIIGNGVTTIGKRTFYNNDLTSVNIPDSVTSIGESAFETNDLTSVIIGNSVTTIGSFAFQNNALTSVNIPDSVTSIGESAFETNDLTSVIIGNSVTTIGSFAFQNNALTSVTIPASVTSIGEFVFNNNALTSAHFGGNFGDFQLNMFDVNPTLTTITYCEGITSWPQDFSNGSTTITATSIVCSPPDAPTIDSITPGAGQLTVAFTPGIDNGSPAYSYEASCLRVVGSGRIRVDVVGPTSPITVPSMYNGDTYECFVTATNIIGTSPASATSEPFVVGGPDTVAPPSSATPVPTSPLWLLGIMAGLLSLVGIRKLRKA
ncbi:leucine-rich repeat domain-containing protein [Halioglobus sp. Uisw_031]|uniref:leucine-rich repeat domain-containing protein n=1 Tax=Halioglobus sp. Uisw_031 TaxID=3230977 RepID=UPI0039E8DA17